MPTFKVPIEVTLSEKDLKDRPLWDSELIEHLGPHARRDTAGVLDGDHPTIAWTDEAHCAVYVVITDVASVDIPSAVDGTPVTFEAAAERVVVRALIDVGHTMHTSRVDSSAIERIGD